MYRITLGSLLMFSVITQAQDDHLIPARGIFSYTSTSALDNYYQTVARSLTSGVERSMGSGNLRIIVLPSFEKEWLLQINFFDTEKDECPIVILSLPERRVSSGDLLSVVKNELVKKCIDKKLAGEVSQAVKLVMKETRYSQNVSSGLDGTTYYFSSFVDGLGVVDATTWSPPENTKMNCLVNLARSLKEYVLSKEDDTSDIKKFLKSLKRKQRKESRQGIKESSKNQN